MKSITLALLALAVIPAAGFAQNGTDINQAIPIYFGQTINDTIDSSTRPSQVYSITLSKGQSFTATLKTTNGQTPNWSFVLGSSAITTIAGSSCGSYVAQGLCQSNAQSSTINYQVAAAGTYYLVLVAFGNAYGSNTNTATYQLQVTAQGTPITTPNPPQAGCLTGQVNSITYSLQLVAAGLPDTVSIGGAQACASCTVKPPAYPALVSKMETAMGLGVGVSACMTPPATSSSSR